MKVYGIKNCGTVRKALKFFDEKRIDYRFVDIKKEPLSRAQIEKWLKKVSIEELLNSKGAKFRALKLKNSELDDRARLDWMEKENLIVRRPIIEYGRGAVLVGFDESRYEEIFG